MTQTSNFTASCGPPDGALTTFDPPDACTTFSGIFVSAINPAGVIVGSYTNANCVTGRGFLRARDGTFSTFEVPGATSTEGYGINPEGAVTGDFFDASGVHIYLRAPNGIFTTFDSPSGQGIEPGPINPEGVTTGYYSDASGIHGFLWTKH